MKRFIKDFLLAIVLGIIVPGIVFFIADKIFLRIEVEPIDATELETTNTTVQTFNETENNILVLQSDGTQIQMELDTYLTGVVLGEMPVDFHVEAMKAQAVVARTYTLKRSAGSSKHANGAVCKESACCQAYRSTYDFLQNGGSKEALNKVISAVESTSGQVLYYEDTLIDATYFSCSGGRTEDAQAVWGADIPYLRAVDSPGEENAAHYTDSIEFSDEEFFRLLNIDPVGFHGNLLGKVTYTAGGGVATMEIAGESFEGVYLREKLGLRSTAFSITVLGDTIYITTKGFGHRVGMSQYGAEAMAVSGSSYQEILSHYYPGTELVIYSNN